MALPPSWTTPSLAQHISTTSNSNSNSTPPPSSPSSNQPSNPPTTPTPDNPSGISYTAQLTPRVSPRLTGDKILLPQRTLEALLASASAAHAAAAAAASSRGRNRGGGGESWEGWREEGNAGGGGGGSGVGGQEYGGGRGGEALLPHPITFKVFNPVNSRYTHAVPLEFSGEEGEVGVSPALGEILGLAAAAESTPSSSGGVDSTSQSRSRSPAPVPAQLTVMFKALPKGRYVRLRPLEAGYDEEDWKALLERELRIGYSTLTVGEILSVGRGKGGGDGLGAGEKYKFLIDRLLPEGSEGVTVVDTDMEVEMQPLSEEQARETLQKRLARKNGGGVGRGKGGGKAKGGKVGVGEVVEGGVRRGEYIDFRLEKWDRRKGVAVELVVGEGAGGDEGVGGMLDLLVSTSRYTGAGGDGAAPGPREDEYVWGDLGNQSVKRVAIGPGNVELLPLSEELAEASGEGEHGVEYLSITVHGYAPPGDEASDAETPFRLRISQDPDDLDIPDSPTTPPQATPGPTEKLCTNCHQAIPQRTYPLHTAFCHRNNIPCPHHPPCAAIFHRNTPHLTKTHWHCPHCPAKANDGLSPAGLQKHISTQHTPRACPSCAHPAPLPSLPALAHHRTTTCPAKPILCRFCHLLVPQDAPSPTTPQHILTTLTPHEHTCGSRTTDCPLCARPVKLSALHAHLRNHTLARLSRPAPRPCANLLCARLGGTANPLGLCAICFGPMYVADDPAGVHLRRRVERRLLAQGVSGCRRGYCRNGWCATGRANLGVGAFEGGMGGVRRGVVEGVFERWDAGGGGAGGGNGLGLGLRLCVDEANQRRRGLVEGVCLEEGYGVEWGVQALEELGGGADEEGVRRWLGRYGVREGER